MKRYAKPLVATMVAVMALAPAAGAFADSGYYVNEKKYLSTDVAGNANFLLKLNNEPGISNFALDLNGARAIYKDFMSTNPSLSNLNKAFEEYAATHSFEVPAGTVIVKPDGSTIADPDAGQVTDLKIESVTAIKGTSVTIQLKNVPSALPGASSFVVTDDNGLTYAATKLAATTVENEYVLTLGTSVTGKGVLTVKHGNSSATKAFDTTLDGITLKASISDEDSTLIADGADNTILTVNVLKDGVIDTTFDGTVKFVSLKGATFAKQTVAFDKGVAKVQLTAMSSVTPIVDTILVAITDADDISAVGKTTQLNISYVPKSETGEAATKVFATYAESDRTSDVYLQFNKEFNFESLYAEWNANKPAITASDAKGLHTPIDIVKFDNKTIKLVFDQAGALTDNSEITVNVTGDGVNSNLITSSIKFNLVDPKAPEALSVSTPDYRTVITRFSEPVTTETAAEITNWVLNGKQLVGADVESIKIGKAIVENGEAVPYEASATNPVDNRNYVTIKLNATGASKLKAEGKENLLQAYNVKDYAAISDLSGQNTATTQEFKFVTPATPNSPQVELSLDSPEQFKVKFNQPLKMALSAADFTFEYGNGIVAGEQVWVELDTEDPGAYTAEDVTVTAIGTDNSEYLVELNSDWTVIHKTKATGHNYYAPGYNKVKITVDKTNVFNFLDVQLSENVVLNQNLVLDASSPTIAHAEQVIDAANVPQQLFNVTMSEPVQMNTGVVASDSTPLTPSESQADGQGVPTPTFQFVSKDGSKTVDGALNGAIDKTDTKFQIKPETPLTAGEWTLYIRSISDDVGNTAATTSHVLEVKGAAQEVGEAKVIWAVAYNDVVGKGDIVEIQFGTEMSLDALTSTVYTINGKELPTGVMITSLDEADYDVDGDGTFDLKGTRVIITLPADFLSQDGLVSDYTTPDDPAQQSQPHMLNISKSLKDAEGNSIKGLTELPLTYGTPKH